MVAVEIVTKSLLLVTVSIVLFTLLYRAVGRYSWIDSLWNSVMTQTLAGAKMPHNTESKVIMIVQALVSFLIITHAIVLVSRSSAAAAGAKQRREASGEVLL
jgi:steroid 5-alpha reductase family enzyme